jgi:hypothetical protein
VMETHVLVRFEAVGARHLDLMRLRLGPPRWWSG